MSYLIRTANGLEISRDLDCVPDERELPELSEIACNPTGFFIPDELKD